MAQPRILPPILAVDNPESFEPFLTDQQQFESALISDAASAAPAKNAARERFARSAGLSGLSDYEILHQAASKMIADTAVTSGRTREKTRQEARERAVEQLRKTLSADSYNRLRAYLFSSYKNGSGGGR